MGRPSGNSKVWFWRRKGCISNKRTRGCGISLQLQKEYPSPVSMRVPICIIADARGALVYRLVTSIQERGANFRSCLLNFEYYEQNIETIKFKLWTGNFSRFSCLYGGSLYFQTLGHYWKYASTPPSPPPPLTSYVGNEWRNMWKIWRNIRNVGRNIFLIMKKY